MQPTRDISRLLTRQRPLGPSSADEMHRTAAIALYEGGSDIDEALASAPVFMIGRRGSGKTAVLKATFLDDELDVDLDVAILLNQVADLIRKAKLLNRVAPADLTVAVWNAAFVVALLTRIRDPYCKLTEEACPDAWKFTTDLAGLTTTEAVCEFFDAAMVELGDDPGPNIGMFLDKVTLGGVALRTARVSLEKAVERQGCQAIVSLDSLDHYEGLLWQGGGGLLTPEALALQSLYRAASAVGRDSTLFYKVRVAFPSELWHFYKDLSQNPLKDFDSCVLLHWDGKDLLKICAARFRQFLKLHEPDEFARLRLDGLNPVRKSAGIFLRYLPPRITNSLGVKEHTVPYLLRHTQLLPRHLIMILNKVFEDHAFKGAQVSEEHIRLAVNSAETIIADTVVDAYSLPYPLLRQCCESIIPLLNLRFKPNDLQRVCDKKNTFGLSFHEVLRMFVEAGVVGRVREISATYAKADFEYLLESKLFVTENDELCLHPVFAHSFGCTATIHPETEANSIPIYPLGSDYETDSVRNGGVFLNVRR